MLLDAGLGDEVGAVVSALTSHEAEELGWAELKAAVDRLRRDVLHRFPRVLLHLSRVSETGYRMDIRRDCLERLAAVSAEADAALRRELDAERARDLVWDERTRREARELAVGVLGEAGPEEEVARARALDALGRLRSWWSEDGPHDDAVSLLEESALLARRLGQPVWAARAPVPLAMAVHFDQCRPERALRTLDEAIALLPHRSRYRVLCLTFRCAVLCELDRMPEAEACLDEVRALAMAVDEEWLLAYVAWTESEVASWLGDRARTVEAVLEAQRHKAAWFDETAGIEFLAQTADFLDRTGEHRLATAQLARAHERMTGFERVVRVYEACVYGRSGDPARAEEVVAAVLAREDLSPQERWPIAL